MGLINLLIELLIDVGDTFFGLIGNVYGLQLRELGC